MFPVASELWAHHLFLLCPGSMRKAEGSMGWIKAAEHTREYTTSSLLLSQDDDIGGAPRVKPKNSQKVQQGPFHAEPSWK